MKRADVAALERAGQGAAHCDRVRPRWEARLAIVGNVFLCAFATALAATSPVAGQSNADLLKLDETLNDMCRDGAGSKTGEACDARELVGQMLRARNICFVDLGKVGKCRSNKNDGAARGDAAVSDIERMHPRPKGSCRRFAEREIIEVKGFLVEFDYAAEETAPSNVKAIALDEPICFEKEPDTRLRTIILNVKNSTLLGRHCRLEMRMEAGDGWSGIVQSIAEDKTIPE